MTTATEWTLDDERPRDAGDVDLTRLHDPLRVHRPPPWSITERLALALLGCCLGAVVLLWVGW